MIQPVKSTFPQDHQPEKRIFQHIDTRVRIVTALLLIVGILLTPDYAWIAYPLIWTLIGTLASISRIGAWRLGRLAGIALPFALAAITLLVTTPGRPVATLAGLVITDTGLGRFLGIVFKSWLSMQVALLLSLTSDADDLLEALASMGVSETLIAIISFMYRYLFTLREEAERLLRARAARSGTMSGARPGGSLRWRARVTGGMVGNLFLRSYERSERVYAAMLARGYNGQIRYQEKPPLTWRAISLGAVPVVMMIIIQVIARL